MEIQTFTDFEHLFADLPDIGSDNIQQHQQNEELKQLTKELEQIDHRTTETIEVE